LKLVSLVIVCVGKVEDTGTTYKYKMQLVEGEEQGEESTDPVNVTGTSESGNEDPQTRSEIVPPSTPTPAAGLDPQATPDPPVLPEAEEKREEEEEVAAQAGEGGPGEGADSGTTESAQDQEEQLTNS
jgi:hypothetical protein